MLEEHKLTKSELAWLCLVFWAVALTALEASFSFFYNTNIQTWQLWTDAAISLIFLCDIAYQFRTRQKQDAIVPLTLARPGQKLKKHKPQSAFFWWSGIALGLMAAIPFDVIAYNTGLDQASLHLFTLIRLFRLVRIIKLFTIMSDYSVLPGMVKTQLVAGSSLIVVHLMALLWGGMHPAAEGVNDTTHYITCLYWTITTLTTIGYGDITPTTNIARLYTMGVMILGVGVYGIIIGNVARILTQADRYKEQSREKLQDLMQFMRHYNIPERLQNASFSYQSHITRKRLTDNDAKIIADLPHALQQELQTYMNMKLIGSVPVFKYCSHACLKAVASNLEQVYFSPGQNIINIGEMGDEMFIIEHGVVEVILKDGSNVASLHEGQFFGEAALLHETKRNANVRAQTYCDLYKLKKEDFDRIIQTHPELMESMRKITNKRSTDRERVERPSHRATGS